ncbi:MAG: hypothetical protein GXO11_00815 [Epsilonproteobacteria bacterium]|nr:hypothetical protein [Campylobacterota bacterium]
MNKTPLSLLLATTLSLFIFSGCDNNTNDDDNGGSSIIEDTKDAGNAYTSIRLSPQTGVFSPFIAIELAGTELSKDLNHVLTSGTTVGSCYTGYLEYYKTGDSVATLNYHNCKVQNNKILNGKATISPLGGANVTVRYEGFAIQYLNSYVSLDTTVTYNGWDTIENTSKHLTVTINGHAFSAYKSMDTTPTDSNTTAPEEILNGYAYDYVNMNAPMTVYNDSITQYSANGNVNFTSNCSSGNYQITTFKPMQVTDLMTLNAGYIKISNAEYEFGSSQTSTNDTNESNTTTPTDATVTLTIYGEKTIIPQSALIQNCSN